MIIACAALLGALAAPAYAKITFTNATLLHGWKYGSSGGYARPGYAIDSLGVVHLRGGLTNGSSGSEAFLLPKALRPGYNMYLPIYNENSLVIASNGEVTLSGPYVHPCCVYSIDAISFVAQSSAHIKFKNAALLNGWTAAGFGNARPGYAIDSLGIVHLRGGLASGTSGDEALILPPALRPSHKLWLPIYTGGNSEGSLVISSGGQVIPTGPEAGSYASLDGVSFVAGSSPKVKFTNATLENGWKYGGSGTAQPGYAIDSLGIVHLRGSVAGGSSGHPAFDLPNAFCPTHELTPPIYSYSFTEDILGVSPLYSKGPCAVGAGAPGGGANSNVSHFASLDGISFVAGQ